MSEIIYERPGLNDRAHSGEALIDSKRFAFLLLIGADIMLFAGLIGGYVVLKANSLTWPPPGSPELNPWLMLWSCIAIIASYGSFTLANRAVLRAGSALVPRWLVISIVSLIAFLAVNVAEWVTLFDHGLRIQTVFGGIYLINMGAFLIQAIACVPILILLATGKMRSASTFTHLKSYFFVLVLIWMTLYLLIYI